MKNIIAFIVLSLMYQSISSQDCIETGEFDDSPCNVCAPAGWSPIMAAEIDNEANLSWCQNISESPTGGTMVYLTIIGNTSEGIETTFNDLIPGYTYSIGFWWLSCDSFDGGNLIIEIDGTTYTFPATFDWELVSLCVTAESSSMDVLILGEANGPQNNIFIDDALCSEIEPCCSLIVDLEDEETICPNEVLILEADISDAQGTVDIEWTSDPSEGLSYLSETDIENPIFNYTNTDFPFNGIEYTFTITVVDGPCEIVREIDVIVSPLEEITFDFVFTALCETDGTFTFPMTSNEGFSGTWDISEIDLEYYAGETVDNTFTPNLGQTDCPQEYIVETYVEEFTIPEFDLPISFCTSDQQFDFPETSQNGVYGTWEDPVFFPENNVGNTYTNSFTPEEFFCTANVEIQFEIIQSILPLFTLQDSLCQETQSFLLPDESDNQISGVWTPSIVNPLMIVDSLVCIFSPVVEDCIDDYRHVFYLTENIHANFNIPDTICKNAPQLSLSNISLEGEIGEWNITALIADTILIDSVNLYWIPNSSDQCLDTVFKTIHIQELEVPEFDLPTSVCISSSEFTFPNISLNGIEGSWDSPSFLPNNITGGFLDNTFTPDVMSCSSSLDISILVTDGILPEFNLPDILCETDNPYLFPTMTNQNTMGYWEYEFLDPEGLGGEVFINTFFNTDINNNCINESTDFSIYIQPLAIPTFAIPAYICSSDAPYDLPLISSNAIEGTWNISAIDPGISNALEIDLVFTPNDLECFELFEMSINIIEEFNGQVSTIDATTCNANDGVLNIVSTQSDLNFSIDNGMSWQNELMFEQLSAGSYQLLIRNINLIDCEQSIPFVINNPMMPIVTEVILSPNSSCTSSNGMIEVIMGNGTFEYSIDNGVTWQNDNIFTNLDFGIYNIEVRMISSIDCIVIETVEIIDESELEILIVNSTGPSDCGSDATINIFAIGPDLIYSIDDGATWSSNSLFNNLTAGSYDILVSSNELVECFDEEILFISNPELPLLIDIISTNVLACSGELGTIEIVAELPEAVQYSIDNGLNWLTGNVFTDLQAGTYEVLIQYLGSAPNCHSQLFDIEIIEEDMDILGSVNTRTLDPTNCENNDGQIDFGTMSNEFEFSIDGGITWQTSSVFENLIPGIYSVIIRSVSELECQETISSLIINALECPCEEIEIDIFKIDILCSNENNGTINLNTITGYQDQVNNIIWQDGQMGTNATNLDDGWHTFIINYDADCIYEDSVFLERIDPLDFLLESFDTSCGEENNGAIEITNTTGGSGVYNYSLNNTIFQDEPAFYNLSPGDFEALVIDSAGCLKSELIELLQGDVLNIDLPEVMSIELGESIILNPLINSSTIDSFTWSANQNIITQDVLAIEVSPQEATEYTLIIYYGNCIETRTILVNVNNENPLYLGNTFSPNNDGNNDIIYIQSSITNAVEVSSFKIYDRWGNIVFSKQLPKLNKEADGWDGLTNNREALIGVYTYKIEYSILGNINEVMRKTILGHITLVR